MKAKILILALVLSGMTSCMEKGKFEVQNRVHNVQLENISWGDYSVNENLLPGEKSGTVEVLDYKNSFPKEHYLEFYMVGGGNRVYLRTKEKYELDYDNTITIVISDSTEVINPILN